MAEIPTGTVTFLFTDVEGSTRLLQERSDYAALQDQHNRILEEAIAANGGVKIRTEGDSFFAVFESAPAAVAAAVAFQRALHEYPWPEGGTIRVRAGLHTGEGVRGGDDYLGIDVNRAARIAAAAHGGQVLVSDATRVLAGRALPDGVALRDVGAHRLKDLAQPEQLCQLVIEGLPSDFPAPRSLDARPNNLPVQLTSFVGRARDIAGVLARLRAHRFVTLSGPGGTGKTRLALQVAAESLAAYRDGVYFVDLSPVTDPERVLTAIASALHVPERHGREPLETLIDYTHDREMLLVLDNFEQVLTAAPAIGALLQGGAEMRVLVTSRAVLRVYGENEYPVEPLHVPASTDDARELARSEAVVLFLDRAASAQPGFCLDDANAVTIAQICERLDGLPLAIELAASRIKLLSPAELLAQLGRRLPILTGGAKDLPERQRTLRGAIEWSFDLLGEPERRLLARISIFARGGSLEAIDEVANPNSELGVETIDVLAALVDNSLVRRRVEGGDSRYVLLETIREFASEQLVAHGDANLIGRRHAFFYASLCELGERRFTGSDQRAWLDRFELEQDNLRAAMRWSIEARDAETGLRVLAAVWRFWQQRGLITEGRQWAKELRTLPAEALDPGLRARAASAAGSLAYWQDAAAESTELYQEGLVFARQSGDKGLIVDAMFNNAIAPTFAGENEKGWASILEVLALARELGDRDRLCAVLDAVAYLAYAQGDLAESLQYNEEAAELARETGNRFVLAETTETIGQVHRRLGDYDRSRRAYLEAIRIKYGDGNLTGTVMTLKMFAVLEAEHGHFDEAARLLGVVGAAEDKMGSVAPNTAYYIGDPIAMLRNGMGPEAANRAMRAGREFTLEQVVASLIK